MVKKDGLLVLLIIIGFFIIANIFWVTSDFIGDWAVYGNSFLVVLVDLGLNPYFWALVIVMVEVFLRGFDIERDVLNYLRVILASIIFSLAVETVTILHSFRMNYTLIGASNVSIYFDTVTGLLLQSLIGGWGYIGTWILYVLIPIIMAILSVFIASPKAFIGIFKKEIGMNN